MRSGVFVLSLLGASVVAMPALVSASDSGLVAHRVPGDGVRVDGSLTDWRGVGMVRAGSGRDAAFGVALGFDDDGLYVAADVRDERIVRDARPGTLEDALIVTLAAPVRGKTRAVDIWLYPGIAGRLKAAGGMAGVGGAPVADDAIKVVEGPPRSGREGDGYVIEAFIPFRSLRLGDRWAYGRAAARLRDVDLEAHPSVEAEPATAPVSKDNLENLPLLTPEGGMAGLIAGFAAEQGLRGVIPRFSFEGDVAGDDARERVVILGPYVLVLGPAYRSGESYSFFRLPVARHDDVRAAALVELTGDDKEELVARIRQENEHGRRFLYFAMGIEEERIAPLFGIELRKERNGGHVQAYVRVQRRPSGPPDIEARIGRSVKLSPETYVESPAEDAMPILLPWGEHARERYRWDGSRLALVGSTPNPRARDARRARVAASENRAGDTAAADQIDERTSSIHPKRSKARRAARSRTAERRYDPIDLMAAIRRDHRVPTGTPARFRQRAQLAGDSQEEEALVFGRVLAVFGPGFGEGLRYFGYDIPVESNEDVIGVEAADITGDGTAELLIRVRQKLGEVTREVMLVHRFAGQSFPRLAAIEVARAHEGNRIVNEVRVAGRGRSARLTIRPGRARGWNESTWSFAEGTGDGVEPLLLPWRDRPVAYELRSGRLIRRR